MIRHGLIPLAFASTDSLPGLYGRFAPSEVNGGHIDSAGIGERVDCEQWPTDRHGRSIANEFSRTQTVTAVERLAARVESLCWHLGR